MYSELRLWTWLRRSELWCARLRLTAEALPVKSCSALSSVTHPNTTLNCGGLCAACSSGSSAWYVSVSCTVTAPSSMDQSVSDVADFATGSHAMKRVLNGQSAGRPVAPART